MKNKRKCIAKPKHIEKPKGIDAAASSAKHIEKPKGFEGALNSAKDFAKFLLLYVAAVLSLALCIFCVSACASLEKKLSATAAPYAIYDTQIAERESTGIEFAFANLSGKEIQSVKFFARISGGSADSYSDDFLTDDDGFEKEFLFDDAIEAGGAERVFIPFEEFAFDEEIETYFVESLYVAEMFFEDGTLWHGTQQIY